MDILRAGRRFLGWGLVSGRVLLRLKVLSIALIGLTVVPAIYYVLHVRRCKDESHEHDLRWYRYL